MSKGEVVSARWDGTALTVIITGGTWVSGVHQITERWSTTGQLTSYMPSMGMGVSFTDVEADQLDWLGH